MFKNLKIKNVGLAAMAALMLTTAGSCERDFLETSPTDKVGAADAVSTADNLMLIINGMHRNMYVRQNSSQGQVGQTGINIMLDALGEDLVFPTTGNGWYVSTARWQDQVNANGSNDFFPYQFYYALIRNANYIINLGDAATGDQNTKDRAMGQAYAFRAFSHYMLVQFYGKRYVAGGANDEADKGIVIRTDLGTEAKARNTVAEVYAQINTDLNQALTLLNAKGRVHKSHFDDKVVKGLMARVALTKGDYQEAADKAKEARAGYTLMNNADYKAGFNSLANAEWMWGSEIISDQTEYFGNFGGYMSRNYNSTNIRQNPKAVNSALFAKFPKTDVRKSVIDSTGNHLGLLTEIVGGKIVKKSSYSSYSLFPYTSQKFLSVSQSDSRMDVPYMRAAEMYLIEAEALARLGKEAESRVAFNVLAKNRDPQYVPVKTGAAYLEEIMDSRRLELWGEGFRFLDLKRLNLPLNRRGANHESSVIGNIFEVAAGDKKWQYLIPKTEINANPLVKQNEV